MELSVIIANWNGKDLIGNCLKSLKEHVDGIQYEIVVVDNGSSDRSAEFIKEHFPDVILILNDKNEGFSRANNQGIRVSKGKYILLLNNDTIVLQDAIVRLLEFIKARPDAGAVSSQLLNSDMTIQRHCRRFPSISILMYIHTFWGYRFRVNQMVKNYFMGDWDELNSRDVNQPSAVCLLIKKEILDKIGLLKEKYFLLYNDIDLCKRIKQAGYKIYFCSDSKVVHLGSVSTKRYGRYIEEKYKNLFAFVEAEYGFAILSIFKVLLFVTLVLSYIKRDQLRNEAPKLLKLLYY